MFRVDVKRVIYEIIKFTYNENKFKKEGNEKDKYK